ncbi:MAK10-like protein, partial [Tanacetum coccineum]
AGGKLRDKNAEVSWALLEDLALYDNKSWNDPRDFAKLVKEIYLPQDVPSTSDRHLIEFENQVQHLMEAHLAPKSPIQVNKIASSCKICSGPHDTQCYMENPEQAFVEYASSCTNKARDARLSKFEADFKQQQGKMTNKIDTVLKAINDRITRALSSDTIKNPKLNVNSTSLFLSTRSYRMKDPQCSSRSLNSINAIRTCSRQTSNLQKDQLQMVNKIGTSKLKEPAKALEDEFKDLHLNLPVLEVLAHAPMYNAMLDKYVERDSKPFDTLADLGSCVNLIPLYLFKKLKIGLLEETDHVFGLADGTKSYHIGIVKNIKVHIRRLKLLDDFYVIDMDKDPATSLLVGRGFLATADAVIDYRNAKIAIGEGVTRPISGVKKINLGEEEVPY